MEREQVEDPSLTNYSPKLSAKEAAESLGRGNAMAQTARLGHAARAGCSRAGALGRVRARIAHPDLHLGVIEVPFLQNTFSTMSLRLGMAALPRTRGNNSEMLTKRFVSCHTPEPWLVCVVV